MDRKYFWVTQFVTLAIISLTYNDFFEAAGKYHPYNL